MKHGKRPTRRQKQLITSKRLNHNNWLVVKDSRETFDIVHKTSGKVRSYPKLKGVIVKCVL
ncbi:DUF6906 family protein [Vallitalea maricola]|uniref:Uncharacterized protein n=2 Tax=Vallitalea maricola TaxID=3074433 RepID=A0ACB5UKP3_9FIRM|nr:hypothetical protein AN2V17_27630 [Vallitalea sp. AN17-2]